MIRRTKNIYNSEEEAPKEGRDRVYKADREGRSYLKIFNRIIISIEL